MPVKRKRNIKADGWIARRPYGAGRCNPGAELHRSARHGCGERGRMPMKCLFRTPRARLHRPPTHAKQVLGLGQTLGWPAGSASCTSQACCQLCRPEACSSPYGSHLGMHQAAASPRPLPTARPNGGRCQVPLPRVPSRQGGPGTQAHWRQQLHRFHRVLSAILKHCSAIGSPRDSKNVRWKDIPRVTSIMASNSGPEAPLPSPPELFACFSLVINAPKHYL